MRIRIVGGAGSGKSTLARRLSKKYGISHYDMDDIFFVNRDDYSKFRDEKERDKLLRNVMRKKDWILEGTYTRDWAIPTFKKADKVIFIQTPAIIKQYRILTRWIKSKIRQSNRKEGNIKQLLILLRYCTGSDKRQIPRLQRMDINHKLIIIKKTDDYK